MLDYDRILVLKEGAIAELDTPRFTNASLRAEHDFVFFRNLLKVEGGIFKSMCQDAGVGLSWKSPTRFGWLLSASTCIEVMKGSKWCSDSLISRPQCLVSGIIASQSQDIQYLSATSSLPEQHLHCYQFTWKVLNCYCIAISRSWPNQSTSVSNGFHPVVVCQDDNWWSPHVVKLVGINPHHAHV